MNILPRRKEIELSVLLNGHVGSGDRHLAHGEMCFTCGTTSAVTVGVDSGMVLRERGSRGANDTGLCGGGH